MPMILRTRGTRLASKANLSITMDRFRLKGQSLQWIASLLFITLVASADEGSKGAIIYKAVRGSDDSLAKPLEFGSVEVFPQVVNYTPVGSQAKQRVMKANVVAVVEFPNLLGGTFTTDAQFEELRKKGAEIKALSDRYPATKASFNPVIQAIADALSRHQAGEVLVSGQWTAKARPGQPMASVPPVKGAIPELAVTDELGRTRTFKNVRVTSVGLTGVQISHSSGAASIPVEKLPKDILELPEVAAKLAEFRKREAERVAALAAAKAKEEQEKAAMEKAKADEEARKEAELLASAPPKDENSEKMAIAAARQVVSGRLTAPGSARWVSDKVLEAKHPRYMIVVTVDSQNGFGALLRNTLLCSITLQKDSKFICNRTVGLQEIDNDSPLEVQIQLFRTLNDW